MNPAPDRSPIEPAPALIAVLAGGYGDRLGGDKPGATLGGHPLIAHPLAAARSAARAAPGAPDPLVVAKPDTVLPPLRARILREPAEPAHPLCGIVAALREADGRHVVAIACDMPFVTPELLAWLASLAVPLAVPSAGGRLHPLLALYGPSLLSRLQEALDAERPLQETVAALRPREIATAELERFGVPERLLLNVNTADDLAAAERLLGPAASARG